MRQQDLFRLLPTGATTLSGALTCVAVVTASPVMSVQSINYTKYETDHQSLHAPFGALYSWRDALLAEKGIPNTPLEKHITAMKNLAVRCLEPTRQHFGLPILVTSGFRSVLLNTEVKGASNSQHMAGEAADITIPRKYWPFCYTCQEQIARLLFTWMKNNIDLDQLILEHSGLSWWVHVSCRVNFRHNRHQKLKIENGKTTIVE